MKTHLNLTAALLLFSTLILQHSTLHGQSSAFTYQGFLTVNGAPANAIYDLRFAIYGVASGGVPIASAVDVEEAGVTNGIFTVTLDFGAGVFDGSARWLDIAVRPGASMGAHTNLVPRQPIASTPYAVRAGGAAAAGITGALPATALSGTYSGAVTFNNAANSFAGNGAGLTNLNATSLGGVAASNYWRIGGNAGVTTNRYIGTTDYQPMEIRVNNSPALRMIPSPQNWPNLVGGASNNYAHADNTGVAIGGGVGNGVDGTAGGSYIGGGRGNRMYTNAAGSVIGGGTGNQLGDGAVRSVIGGGWSNWIGGATGPDAANVARDITDGTSNTILVGETFPGNNFIGGGWANRIGTNSPNGAIVGGRGNSIGDGTSNTILIGEAEPGGGFIGGGRGNAISGDVASDAIVGGDGNFLFGDGSVRFIGGGVSNRIEGESVGDAIVGGSSNIIFGDGSVRFIANGINNVIDGTSNTILVGGGENRVQTPADYAFLGGGWRNTNSGAYSVITGGGNNRTTSDYATVGGGLFNTAGNTRATVAGGQNNTAGGGHTFIGGGQDNTAPASHAVVSGGSGNNATSTFAAVGGGEFNTAGGTRSVVGGGAGNQATGARSAVAGGESNQATGSHAAIPGGTSNTAGQQAFAAGSNAKAVNTGAFVWADAGGGDFSSTANNQFSVRATGGARFETGGAGFTVDGASVFTGNNGAGLTGLNASALASGTVPDARLSANVARRDQTNTFAGVARFNSSVGVGNVAPTTTLDVNGTVRVRGGSPGAGRILGGDASGLASWVVPRARPQVVVVDASGLGDFTTIGAAMAAVAPTEARPVVIEVRPGNYFERVIMKSHVHLRGAGAASTAILFNPAGVAVDADFAVVRMNGLTNVALSGVTLGSSHYTNAPTAPAAAVGVFDQGSSPVIRECRFTALLGYEPVPIVTEVFGVLSTGGSRAVIEDCEFDLTSFPGPADAVYLLQSSARIQGCLFDEQFERAVFLDQSASASILACTMRNLAQAVRVHHATASAVIAQNFISATFGQSAGIYNAGAARIEGNEISGPIEHGIRNLGTALISGNLVQGSTVAGLLDTSAAGSVAVGNRFLNCGGSGERAVTLINTETILQGNTFTGSPVGDINAAGGNPIIGGNRTTGGVAGAARIANHGAVTLSTTTTSNLVVAAPGGVGIGTTTPLAALDVRTGGVSIGSGAAPGAGSVSNQLHLMVGANTNGAANGISFIENNTGFGMKLGYDGTGSGAENRLVIYDDGNEARFAFENGGNLGVNTNNPAHPVHHASGAHLTAAGVWTSVSDRDAKTDYTAIEPAAVLAKVIALPVSQWRYKVEAGGVKHIGPVAQDFHSAFGLGESDTAITTVDADGVALAAIQGLNSKVEVRGERVEGRIRKLEAENAELKRSLAEIKRMMETLVKQGN